MVHRCLGEIKVPFEAAVIENLSYSSQSYGWFGRHVPVQTKPSFFSTKKWCFSTPLFNVYKSYV